MCHHTREPTVLSTVSCRPSHLNVDRFHQPCLFSRAHSRIGEDYHPRTTWRPLTLAGGLALPSVRLTGGFCHARSFVLLSLRVPHHYQAVCTRAGSGASRVRSRLLPACLGDPIHLATGIVELVVNGLVANVGIGILCLDFVCLHLCE